MRALAFGYVIVVALIPLNLDSVPLFLLPPVQFYVGDLLTAGVVLLAAKAIMTWRSSILSEFESTYAMFLCWIVLAVVRGFNDYGYRAIGESRTVVHFFTFFIPYALTGPTSIHNTSDIVADVITVIKVAALCGTVAFLLGPLFGVQQTDFRGERVLNSNQTYSVVLASAGLLLMRAHGVLISRHQLTKSLLLFVVGILSKNRTALVSLLSVFTLFFFAAGQIRFLLTGIVITVLLLSLVAYSFPAMLGESLVALGGILDPANDPNFSWRLAVQAAALEHGMQTFWLGEGYGSYFNYEVEIDGRLRIEEITPHNQYLTIFLKAGVIGVLLCVVTIVWSVVLVKRRITRMHVDGRSKSVLVILMLATLSQLLYGISYDFQVFFGMYLGFMTLIGRSLVQSHRQNNLPIGVDR